MKLNHKITGIALAGTVALGAIEQNTQFFRKVFLNSIAESNNIDDGNYVISPESLGMSADKMCNDFRVGELGYDYSKFCIEQGLPVDPRRGVIWNKVKDVFNKEDFALWHENESEGGNGDIISFAIERGKVDGDEITQSMFEEYSLEDWFRDRASSDTNDVRNKAALNGWVELQDVTEDVFNGALVASWLGGGNQEIISLAIENGWLSYDSLDRELFNLLPLEKLLINKHQYRNDRILTLALESGWIDPQDVDENLFRYLSLDEWSGGNQIHIHDNNNNSVIINTALKKGWVTVDQVSWMAFNFFSLDVWIEHADIGSNTDILKVAFQLPGGMIDLSRLEKRHFDFIYSVYGSINRCYQGVHRSIIIKGIEEKWIVPDVNNVECFTQGEWPIANGENLDLIVRESIYKGWYTIETVDSSLFGTANLDYWSSYADIGVNREIMLMALENGWINGRILQKTNPSYLRYFYDYDSGINREIMVKALESGWIYADVFQTLSLNHLIEDDDIGVNREIMLMALENGWIDSNRMSADLFRYFSIDEWLSNFDTNRDVIDRAVGLGYIDFNSINEDNFKILLTLDIPEYPNGYTDLYSLAIQNGWLISEIVSSRMGDNNFMRIINRFPIEDWYRYRAVGDNREIARIRFLNSPSFILYHQINNRIEDPNLEDMSEVLWFIDLNPTKMIPQLLSEGVIDIEFIKSYFPDRFGLIFRSFINSDDFRITSLTHDSILDLAENHNTFFLEMIEVIATKGICRNEVQHVSEELFHLLGEDFWLGNSFVCGRISRSGMGILGPKDIHLFDDSDVMDRARRLGWIDWDDYIAYDERERELSNVINTRLDREADYEYDRDFWTNVLSVGGFVLDVADIATGGKKFIAKQILKRTFSAGVRRTVKKQIDVDGIVSDIVIDRSVGEIVDRVIGD